LAEDDAGGVINADVDEFPADAEMAIDPVRLPSGDRADRTDPAKLAA
jgi:hypothetical protein